MLIPFDYLFKKYKIKADGVLHLGANTGQEADAYDAQKIPQVIWVEALPEIYMRLQKHVDPRPNHMPIQACLSDVDGAEVTFNIASNDGQSSSFLEFGTHSKEHPTVKFIHQRKMYTRRMDSLARSAGLQFKGRWFLNADLQGAELLALKGMGDLLKSFDWAYVEVNDRELYKGCPHTSAIDEYLSRFQLYPMETKMTGAGWGDRMYCKPCP